MAKEKFYNTLEFQNLKSKWDKKLKNSGFEDIESGESSILTKQYFTVEHKNIIYFEKCKDYLDSGKIKDKIDLFIFENHCMGISNRKITNLIWVLLKRKIDHKTTDARLLRLLKCAEITPIEFNI